MPKRGSGELFVDVCTQRDYLHPDGLRPSHNLLPLRRNLKRMMAYARWLKIPTLSCVESRRAKDVLGTACSDCILGTSGQRKPTYTLMPSRVVIDTDNTPSVGLDLFEQQQQAILIKSHRDPFANPKFDRLLTELPVERYVLFGVALEESIRLLALGLLLRNRDVTIVADACGYWSAEDADMALRQLSAKNTRIVTTRQYLEAAITAGVRRPAAQRERTSRHVA